MVCVQCYMYVYVYSDFSSGLNACKSTLHVIFFYCINTYICIQLASQMWLFGRLLPILIGSSVPEDDERCQCSLILSILCLHDGLQMTPQEPKLRSTTPTSLYSTLINLKMHFLVHAPRIMMEYIEHENVTCCYVMYNADLVHSYAIGRCVSKPKKVLQGISGSTWQFHQHPHHSLYGHQQLQ